MGCSQGSGFKSHMRLKTRSAQLPASAQRNPSHFGWEGGGWEGGGCVRLWVFLERLEVLCKGVLMAGTTALQEQLLPEHSMMMGRDWWQVVIAETIHWVPCWQNSSPQTALWANQGVKRLA